MGRDTIQLETAVSTISPEYLLEFTSEYGISDDLHLEFPGPEERVVDFSKVKVGVYTKFFEFANFHILISQFLFDILDMDLFNLISDPNPSKVKTGLRPRAAHKVLLLTATASRVMDMEDPDVATESYGTPSAIEKSPLDFDNENPSPPMTEGKGTKDQAHETVAPKIPSPINMPATGATSEVSLEEEVAAMGPRLSKKRHRRANDGADANAPPNVLRKDYASVCLEQSNREGKSLPTMGLAASSTFVTPADTKGVSGPDPMSYVKPQPHPEQSMTRSFEIPTGNVATMEVQDTHSAKSVGSRKSTSSPSMVGSPGGIYQPGWGVTNSYRLEIPNTCQDVVDHIAPPWYFSELRHMPNAEFLSQYNKNLAQQVAMGSQLRLHFEQEVRDAFEEFKKYEDDRVEKRYTEIDTCLDALSIDFDEELYPHMLTAIAGRRWVIRHGPRLAVMKCAESIELRQAFANVVSARIAKGMSECLAHGIEHGKAGRGLELEGLKDAPVEVIMASLHLESDSREDAPKGDVAKKAIAANVSRAEKKNRFRVVCRTHEVGSAHHARFDGVTVSVPTVAPQGLVILLADAATQTETSKDDASPRLLRSKSLPPMYNLDWS
nr:hypothetical protein [Tanacetum cinerariifolium]